MGDAEVLAYVKASAAVLDLPLDDEQAQRVAAYLSRTAAMARALDQLQLPEDLEPAEIYVPKPFPAPI
jgi:hypothetical protein